MLRLWLPPGERLEDAGGLRMSVAGGEANVAIAAARMGASTAWLSALPDSALGRRAVREIASHGVDVSSVRWVPGSRMGTFFVELSVPPRPITVIYDRKGSAASEMDEASIDWDVVEGARAVHLTGVTPALSDSCRDLAAAVVRRAGAAGTLVSLDVNYRRLLWPPDECREVVGRLAPDADLLIATAEDARDVFGLAGRPEDVVEALASETGAQAAVLTVGSDGAHWWTAGSRGSYPGFPEAEIVDRIGAGDAFAAGTLLGLLDGALAHGVALGVAMSALKLGIYGDPMTLTREEVERLLHGRGREVSR
jgi:2-dehydro-3-deoxygluconokinase